MLIVDKVEKVDIDIDTKTVLVTSNMSSNELLETIRKTGKETEYVGVKEWMRISWKLRKPTKLKVEIHAMPNFAHWNRSLCIYLFSAYIFISILIYKLFWLFFRQIYHDQIVFVYSIDFVKRSCIEEKHLTFQYIAVYSKIIFTPTLIYIKSIYIKNCLLMLVEYFQY